MFAHEDFFFSFPLGPDVMQLMNQQLLNFSVEHALLCSLGFKQEVAEMNYTVIHDDKICSVVDL